jgi:hypothetical protein
MHNAYEELCALAITGQLSDSERALLDEHMRECLECRTLMEQLQPEVCHLAPAMAELLRVDVAAPAGMRSRFLERAAEQGLHISAGSEVQPSGVAEARIVTGARTRFGEWWEALFPRERFLGFAAVGACFLVAGVAANREWRMQREPISHNNVSGAVSTALSNGNVATVQAVSVSSTLPSSGSASGSASAQEEKELRDRLAGLSQRLEAASAKAAALETANAELERSLSAATQQAELSAAERDAQRSASQSATAQVAALRQQLDDAKSKLVTLDAVATMQQEQTAAAQSRVASLKAEMDQMYAARSSAESLISARNLHIIDVYDDTGKGSGQGAFGRVFYVQGKSLVFYAYDLPDSKRDKNFSFQLWGEGQGLEPVTYKLGLLRPDSGGHGRWVVACDDPKILGQLRGVFIAPPSRRGDPPAPSQKMMYAMLGSANHP